MADQKVRRIIEVDVTTSKGAQRGIREINSQLRSMEGAAKKTQREVKRMSSSFNLMSIAAKAWIALRVARYVTDISDSMILLSARLNIVTEETVGVEVAFSDLFDIATKTRQSIDATGTLYARLGFATKALVLEHQDLLDIVQGVNNTLLLSGASAQESASSIIQLSQAFSKGALDGDEFRSVSEGNVILFGIMQEVLGKTAGELRQFSRDGQLTAKLLAEVLTSEQVKQLQTRVDEIPLTFGQAFTLVSNQLNLLSREFETFFSDTAKGIVTFLNDATLLTKFFGAINAEALPISSIFDVFDLDDVAAHMKRITDTSDGISMLTQARVNNIQEQLDTLLPKIDAIATRAARLEGTLGTVNPFGDENVIGEFVRSRTEATLKSVKKDLKEATDEAAALNDELLRLTEPARAAPVKRDPPSKERDYSEFEQSVLKANDASELFLDNLSELDALFQEGTINADVYAKENEKIEKALLGSGKAAKEALTDFEALGVAIGQTLASSIDNVGDSLFDLAMGLEVSFRETIENILEDIGRLIVKITLLNALKAGLSGTGVGEFLFPVANAKGNVFNNGDVTAFATGGVVNSPTYFPMPNGVGLLGEAGPEAILPLARGTDGKLGVSTSEGAGPNQVTVQIENKGTATEVRSSSATSDINGTIVNVVLDDLRRGGPIRDSVKGIGEY